MFQFFTAPTQDAGGLDAVTLTHAGFYAVMTLIAVLVVTALALRPKTERAKGITTKQLVFSAAAMALGTVTSMIKFADLPMGGSITLFSMLFIVLIGHWYGAKIGITTAVAYGLLQFILQPVFYTLPQVIVDYPLAFGALGISGFSAAGKRAGAWICRGGAWTIFFCIFIRYDLLWCIRGGLQYEHPCVFAFV